MNTTILNHVVHLIGPLGLAWKLKIDTTPITPFWRADMTVVLLNTSWQGSDIKQFY